MNLGPAFKALVMDGDGYEQFYLQNVPLSGGLDDRLQNFTAYLNEMWVINNNIAVFEMFF